MTIRLSVTVVIALLLFTGCADPEVETEANAARLGVIEQNGRLYAKFQAEIVRLQDER